jgi:4-hydroxybenzoate polyprenyltransferase
VSLTAVTESKKSFHPIRFINHYFGWRNWAVLVYNSVPENMYVMFFIALRQELYSIKFVGDFFVFLLFSFFCTTYGYLVNDLGDKELDKIHGKENTFSNDSSTKAGIIVLSFLFVSILLSLQFIRSPFFLFSWLLWFIVATAYSLNVFRFSTLQMAGRDLFYHICILQGTFVRSQSSIRGLS